MSTVRKQQTLQQNTHRLFNQLQLQQIENFHIPPVIRFLLADRFDTKFINSSLNKWDFNYSGRQIVIEFNEFDEYENKLLKYFLAYYIQINSPSNLIIYYQDIKNCFNYLIDNNKEFSYKSFEEVLINEAKRDSNHRVYFAIKFFVKLLISKNFNQFNEADENELEILPRPLNFNSHLYYQEFDDPIDLPTITLIQNGLLKLNADIKNDLAISDETLRNSALLGLVYSTGMRPVQISKLSVQDIRIDTYSENGEFMRFSVLVPYAKQGRYKHSKVVIKLSEETASIILAYVKRFGRIPNQPLFDVGKDAVEFCTNALNKQLFEFAPSQYKEQVKNGEIIPTTYTLSQFRHHLGFSMAVNGAAAEDIAYILGHSTLVTARHYIFSTPNLAQIRAQALGRNPLYQQVIALMMTGDIIDEASNVVAGENIVSFVNDSLHDDIGLCAYRQGCFLEPVRSCYGCVYFHPYLNGEHEKVLESIHGELESVIAISDGTYNARNPLISIHETTKFEIESVIKRCALLKGGS